MEGRNFRDEAAAKRCGNHNARFNTNRDFVGPDGLKLDHWQRKKFSPESAMLAVLWAQVVLIGVGSGLHINGGVNQASVDLDGGPEMGNDLALVREGIHRIVGHLGELDRSRLGDWAVEAVYKALDEYVPPSDPDINRELMKAYGWIGERVMGRSEFAEWYIKKHNLKGAEALWTRLMIGTAIAPTKDGYTHYVKNDKGKVEEKQLDAVGTVRAIWDKARRTVAQAREGMAEKQGGSKMAKTEWRSCDEGEPLVPFITETATPQPSAVWGDPVNVEGLGEVRILKDVENQALMAKIDNDSDLAAMAERAAVEIGEEGMNKRVVVILVGSKEVMVFDNDTVEKKVSLNEITSWELWLREGNRKNLGNLQRLIVVQQPMETGNNSKRAMFSELLWDLKMGQNDNWGLFDEHDGFRDITFVFVGGIKDYPVLVPKTSSVFDKDPTISVWKEMWP